MAFLLNPKKKTSVSYSYGASLSSPISPGGPGLGDSGDSINAEDDGRSSQHEIHGKLAPRINHNRAESKESKKHSFFKKSL
jgi:hypothetical protein